MGLRTTVSTARAVLWMFALLGPVAGCQTPQAVVSRRLIAHIALIDFSGLAPARPVGGLDVSAALPRAWQLLPLQEGALYAHRQWRSPSHATGVGVVHVRLPLPVSAKTLVWLGKRKYNSARDADRDSVPGGAGRLLRQWSDPVGREWVEAENDRYHVTGYVVTCGFDAWVVYAGYRRSGIPNPVEIGLARRSLESVVPAPLAAGRNP